MVIDPGQGSYIPFPKPIPAVVTDPSSGVQWSLCWAEDWNAAVLGALKSLARPESWRGSEIDIAAAVDGGHQLLGNIKEFCGGNFSPPAFYLVQEAVNCPTSPGYQLVRAVDNCGDEYFTWFGVGLFNGLAGNCRFGVRMLDLIDDVQVGGHVCSVHAQRLGQGIDGDWILQWLDCDNNPQETIDSTGSNSFDFVDFVAQRACLTHLMVGGVDLVTGIAGTFAINGPVLCRYP